MNRRNFIKTLASAAGYPALGGVGGSLLAQSAYTGKFLLTVQLEGGVDVTSFCDPKMNTRGEPEINRWARTLETQQAGNIAYAPFADNARFFEKYYQDMLVINGVDAQTNSHTVGVIHNWSGRNAVGYPSITALMAEYYAPDLPLAYLNFGGFGDTGGIIRSTVIDDVFQLRDVVFPNIPTIDEDLDDAEAQRARYRRDSDWQRIQALQLQNMQRLSTQANLLAGDQFHRQSYMDAFSKAEGIKEFGNLLPTAESVQPLRAVGEDESALHRQIQAALLAFSAGVSIAADIVDDGDFDTHDNHDERHTPLLANATDAIDYIWTYAEELGFADRLVVLIGSDFGRTPHYNSGEGKDHWPIGSYIVMERNARFTNQVIGETDAIHNAYSINPSSLQRDNVGGVIIKPAHVHKALRRYLGLETGESSRFYQFDSIEDFNFFS